jgi:hypothetical protein
MTLAQCQNVHGHPWVRADPGPAQEVHRHALDLDAVVLVGVDRGLGRPPVVAVAPVGGQFPQVAAADPVGPVLVARVVRPAGQLQAAPEVGQRLVGDVDRRRLQRERPGPGRVCHGGLLASSSLQSI